MHTHIWRHIRIELPDGWELLQYSRDMAAGRCAFADRTQFRCELSWRVGDGEPDLERMMSDYVARLQEEPDATGVRRVSVASWPGLEATARGECTSRFGAYLADEACVVEVVFLWPEARDAALEAAVLRSVGSEPPQADGARRWRVFGMDLRASAGLALAACKAEAARATLLFAQEGGPRQERFQRFGLVDHWLEGTVADWLVAQVPRGGRVESQMPARVEGHEVWLLTGMRPIQRLGGLITRPAPLAAAAWLCPHDGRLYCASVTGDPTCDPAALAGRRLICCDAIRASRA